MESLHLEKCAVIPDYERVDREENSNLLVEKTIQLAANVTELAETHNELVTGQGKVLNQTMSLLDSILRQCIEVESEQVDLLNYSLGNRDICNWLSQILLNLCLSS